MHPKTQGSAVKKDAFGKRKVKWIAPLKREEVKVIVKISAFNDVIEPQIVWNIHLIE